MTRLVALLKKDLTIELRTGETLVAMGLLALMIDCIMAAGVTTLGLPDATATRLFPVLWWVNALVCATVSIGRTFEYELEHRALDAWQLSGTPLWIVYLSKVALGLCLVGPTQLAGGAILAILLNASVWHAAARLGAVALLVLAGYVAVAILLAAITAAARLKGVLLSLVLLPLLFPLFFGAIEASSALVQGGAGDTVELWCSMLTGLAVIYTALGALLFEAALKE